MLNTEKLFTKLEFAYIMNYYRLKVVFKADIYVRMLFAIQNVIFQFPFNNISLYHILYNYLL